jgi:hypothetical protein
VIRGSNPVGRGGSAVVVIFQWPVQKQKSKSRRIREWRALFLDQRCRRVSHPAAIPGICLLPQAVQLNSEVCRNPLEAEIVRMSPGSLPCLSRQAERAAEIFVTQGQTRFLAFGNFFLPRPRCGRVAVPGVPPPSSVSW